MSLYLPVYVEKIITLLEQNGATDVLLVGGYVRDYLLARQNSRPFTAKDFDIEVYGLSYSQIKEILSPHFRVDIVGQSFGVLKVGRNVDIALPRRESKNGLGHKGFDIETSSMLSPEEAFSRRDFTINAIGMRKDGSFCDPYDGKKDLENQILRAVGPAFKDDPLRVLRGMQFTARFGFKTDAQTLRYCQEVFPEYKTLAAERIYEEWKKWALQGKYLDRGLEFLKNSGWLPAFPELQALVGCKQNPDWHPEGDVWNHTLQVCQAASLLINSPKVILSDDEKLYIIFAALTHDLGKPQTTSLDENNVLRSPEHASIGAKLARKFLENMKAPTRVVDSVEKIVHEHMTIPTGTDSTGTASLSPSPRALRRLAKRLEPANIKIWALLCKADALGCFRRDKSEEIVISQTTKFDMDFWLNEAQKLNVIESAPTPLVNGRDIIPLGVKPGHQMGIILKNAFEAQLDGQFITTEEGIAFILKSGWLEN